MFELKAFRSNDAAPFFFLFSRQARDDQIEAAQQRPRQDLEIVRRRQGV
jgi:hypothetical protein